MRCWCPGSTGRTRGRDFKVYALTLFGAQAVAWTILLGWLHNVTWFGLLLLGPFIGAWVGMFGIWSPGGLLPRVIGQTR
jgi:apolipoprotein N-acyltransferase